MDSGYISSRTIVARRFSDGKESKDCERVVESGEGKKVKRETMAYHQAILDSGYFGTVWRNSTREIFATSWKSVRAHRSITTFTGAVRELLKASFAS